MKSYDGPREYLDAAVPEIQREAQYVMEHFELSRAELVKSRYTRDMERSIYVVPRARYDALLAKITNICDLASGIADAVTAGVTRSCECGCGAPVTSARPEARYASPACRVRAHRARASRS